MGAFDFLVPRRRHVGAEGIDATGSGALAYLEERHAALGSAYEDLHWPLSSVIKWIAVRTPEAYIQFKSGLITDDGDVTNESTAEFLADYMLQFHQFITRVYTVLPRNT